MKKVIYTIILLAAFQFAQGQQVTAIESWIPPQETAQLDGATLPVMPRNRQDFEIPIVVWFDNVNTEGSIAENLKKGDTVWIVIVLNGNTEGYQPFYGVMEGEIKVGGHEGIGLRFPISCSDVETGPGATELCAQIVGVNSRSVEGTFVCVHFTITETSNIAGVDSKEVNIYPNPVQDNLKIENLGNATDISIYSTTGQVVSTVSSAMESVEIDMTNLSAGLYFVKMQEGNNTITKKIQVVK